ncbi:MAG: PhoH family protein [Clostridiales bacterium]|nr:PhoH family protein [Clostridiales bacterium]MDD7309972.1 PhoH family protein [Eubacteriales bacterium]MDY5346247.1 PhoH family protein [Eubacteriales bacterium]
MYERTLTIERLDNVADVFGSFDENIKLIEQAYAVRIVNRETELRITGDNAESVAKTEKVLNGLFTLASRGEPISTQNVRYCISLVNDGNEHQIAELASDVVCVTAKGRPVKGKTLGQKKYLEAIRSNLVTIGVGPAGTGKTYLAVACAVAAFRAKEINRIILTRPAVEAGEKLGFLPGDLQNKVDPYLRPLYDALFDMLGADTYQKYLERGNIEVAPLAFMRGRTLDDSFIILDEAQNTTPEQMKMFLTRIGFNSRVVVNGDITQIDLPAGKRSGLKDAIQILEHVDGIASVFLTSADVVRHELVQRIINAYDKHNAARAAQPKPSPAPPAKHTFRRTR